MYDDDNDDDDDYAVDEDIDFYDDNDSDDDDDNEDDGNEDAECIGPYDMRVWCFLLRMTRAAQHACDLDSRNKHHSQNLDDRMYQLHNSSTNLGLFPSIENVDNT